MAAILPSGMRAISTEISPETGAGGFILPNDRVDVILSRREKSGDAKGTENTTSETILTNIRVLAIDQTVEEKNGQRVVVGKTTTLELTPAPGRNARAVAPNRHAVARAAQPARRQQQCAAARRSRPAHRNQHRPLRRDDRGAKVNGAAEMQGVRT